MIHTPNSARIERFRFMSFDAEAPTPVEVQQEPVVTAAPAVQEVPSPELMIPLMEAAPPPPTFSEQQLEQAKVAAYQQGHSAGAAEAQARAKAEGEQSIAAHNSLLEVIANRITLAAESHMQYLRSQQETFSKMVMAISRKVAGDALRREPYAGVESLLAECMELITGNPEVIVTVAASKLEGLRLSMDLLQRHLNGFKGTLTLAGDEKLGEHDCAITWKNGQAQRDLSVLWNEIEALIRRSNLTTG